MDLTRRCSCSGSCANAGMPTAQAKRILALLLALARDPLLRASVPPILRMRPGEELARQQLTDALSRAVGHRLNESTLDTVVRNVASSWTQSGHLRGHSRKVRQTVTPTAANTAFALLLGYLAGKRGTTLFESLWAQVLDSPPGRIGPSRHGRPTSGLPRYETVGWRNRRGFHAASSRGRKVVGTWEGSTNSQLDTADTLALRGNGTLLATRKRSLWSTRRLMNESCVHGWNFSRWRRPRLAMLGIRWT